MAALIAEHGRRPVLAVTRAALEAARQTIRAGGACPEVAAITATVAAQLVATAQSGLRRVFNLTGTVIHTNLGRATLPEAAIEAIVAAARSPVALEYDLDGGGRGDRDDIVADLLRELTGAAAATVVNNNAAAVFLLLNTLALRKQVLVSRGELVEIGGAFRIPDIMGRAGARLVEVGTTNRTHRHDFAAAIASGGKRVAMLMKVHTSNYAIHGFTAAVAENELAGLAHDAGLPFVVDLGSGTLTDLERWGLPHEPTPRQSIAAGADLVSFSGDKLLGGPQAGILLGSASCIDAMRNDPLARALRLDKMSIAALDWTVDALLAGDAFETLPALRQLSESAASVEQRARALAALLAQGVATAGWRLEVTESRAPVGGGSLPGFELPSWAVAIRAATSAGSAEALAARLRRAAVPVVARVAADAVLLDVRTLLDGDETAIEAAVMNALQGGPR